MDAPPDTTDRPTAAAPGRTRPRRAPMEGEELLGFVARLIVQGYSIAGIARKASLPYPQAEKLHAEMWARVYGGIESHHGPEGLRKLKQKLSSDLEQVIDFCKDEVRRSGRLKKLNTRAINQINGSVKLLAVMHGLNAPIRVESTNLRLHAAVRPADMARINRDPAARAALIAFEEALSLIPPEPAVETTGGEVAGC